MSLGFGVTRKTKSARKSSSSSATSPAAVPRRSLKRASQVLTALPDKPPEPAKEWSIREAIALLQDVILAALDKGYSQEDVAALLNQAGIPVSPSSLRYYLSRLKQSSASRSAPMRSSPARQKPKQRTRAIAPATPAISTPNPAPLTEAAANHPAANHSATRNRTPRSQQGHAQAANHSAANHSATNRSVENVIAYLLDEPETPPLVATDATPNQESSTSRQKRKKRKR
ncbi:hypothetical protein [Thermoleptolyngbya sp. C42_A2020_037]|uniref:hypothetical protein n=1 Tax=Thermoleptolyngbya sp. C42_A2020_037 TaxID=2747799 RepID=UPI0019D91DAE|nr:hypothetical protein [Thermoleptolyngbya sp. C42_A2020_037]MBF2084787.1 hypothetical protein [Thermoleptolyngbya sp. C42_A2020_037]